MSEIAKALLAAQKDLPIATERDGKSHHGKYTTLDKLMETVRPVLTKHGIALAQELGGDAETMVLRTRLIHAASGEEITSEARCPSPGDPQRMGSATTYLRRYALQALVGVAAEQDDDGNRASQPRQGGSGARSAPKRGQGTGAPQGGSQGGSGGGGQKPPRAVDPETDTLTFGKHKGIPLQDVPGDYLEWLLKAKSKNDPNSPLVWHEDDIKILESYIIIPGEQSNEDAEQLDPGDDLFT